MDRVSLHKILVQEQEVPTFTTAWLAMSSAKARAQLQPPPLRVALRVSKEPVVQSIEAARLRLKVAGLVRSGPAKAPTATQQRAVDLVITIIAEILMGAKRSGASQWTGQQNLSIAMLSPRRLQRRLPQLPRHCLMLSGCIVQRERIVSRHVAPTIVMKKAGGHRVKSSSKKC